MTMSDAIEVKVGQRYRYARGHGKGEEITITRPHDTIRTYWMVTGLHSTCESVFSARELATICDLIADAPAPKAAEAGPKTWPCGWKPCSEPITSGAYCSGGCRQAHVDASARDDAKLRGKPAPPVAAAKPARVPETYARRAESRSGLSALDISAIVEQARQGEHGRGYWRVTGTGKADPSQRNAFFDDFSGDDL